jgi:hypothetical protein
LLRAPLWIKRKSRTTTPKTVDPPPASKPRQVTS